MIPLQVLLDVLKGKQNLINNEMHFWEILQYLDWLLATSETGYS